ncbi:MAG TPA: cyclodeaminase/cyclohydrolase family protein [Chloroflexi bacterium]|nr:MAG: methenyltetrahydrofolate cyclohydrolase [Anaerolineaceae bacterium 4572_5.1]HEY84879.1 cyclodeaminase/cyclohydrolase family protein [Chloroflexota bacterium]
MIQNQSVQDFLNALSGKSPTPGGGSVAALNGALGAALVRMVCNVTIGKKKYADAEAEARDILQRATDLQAQLTSLISDDAAAFDKVMAAFGMPRNTEAEKQARSKAIQAAFKEATLVPLATVKACADVMRLGKRITEIGNANAVSDAGSGVLTAHAGLRSATLNVLINLGSLKDKAFVAETEAELKAILSNTTALAEETYALVKESL